MSKKILLSVALVATLTVLAGCQLGKPASQPAEQQSKIKVGVILPLTGFIAEYGIAGQNAAELAKKDSAFVADNIQFIYEDSQNDPKQAVSAFNKLKNVDHVQAIINWGSTTAYALAPLAKQADMPLFAMTVEKGIVGDSKYITRVSSSGEDYALANLAYLRSKGIKKIGALKLELVYCYEVVAGTEKNLATDETFEVIDNFQFNDQDFKTTIAKLKNKQYDAIALLLSDSQTIDFMRQAKEMGYSNTFFGTDWLDSKSLIDKSNGVLDGIFFAAPIVNDEFRSRYIKEFGNDNQIASGSGLMYDFVMAWSKNLQGIKNPSTDQLISAAENIKDFPGVMGDVSFVKKDSDRYIKFPLPIKLIENGQLKIVSQ